MRGQGSRIRIVIAAVIGCAIATTGQIAIAQGRLEVLAQQSIPGVSGLRVVTIRDNQLAACYTVFIMEPSATSDAGAQIEEQPVDTAEQESIRVIREASEHYDQQLADLNANFEAKVGRPPLQTWNNTVGWPYTFTAVVQYELDRAKIAEQYQRVLQTQIPTAAPFATAAPGMKTGNWQDLAEAVRRAIAAPTPATQRTFIDQGGLTSLIDSGFKRMIETPRMAAAGPTFCDTPSRAK
jgi:hypothetical protein